MSAFENISGYKSIKTELAQLCDMIKNKQRCEILGARMIKGIIIYGASGTGKTLMAECFLEECGLNVFKYDTSAECYKAKEELLKIFAEAKKYAPSAVFIDDLDSIDSNDYYNALQIEFDRGKKDDVLVVATANDIEKIPGSLLRAGRFDRKIEVCLPNEKDTLEIIKFYLKDKKITGNVRLENLVKMLYDCSCADIEAIMNEAAMNAVISERTSINTADFVKAYLRREYVSPDIYTTVSDEDLQKVALHEAGHLVACEVLCPDSVGLVSVRKYGRDALNGFVARCKQLPRRDYENFVFLAGKAAVELYYSETCASGCYSDIRKAFRNIRQGISVNGTCGLGMIDVDMWDIGMSENMNARNEAVVHSEMEKYFAQTRNLLLKNREFLEKVTELLVKKNTLLYSDIKKIKETVKITPVAV